MIAMSKLHRIKNYKLSPIEVNKDSKKLGQRKNKIKFFTEAKYRSCFFHKKVQIFQSMWFSHVLMF